MYLEEIDANLQIKGIEKKVLSKFRGKNREIVSRSLSLVKKYTLGKFRKNGDPEIIHPLMVALRVAEIGLGPNSVSAALLHDLIEDNGDHPTLQQELSNICNDDIIQITKALTIIKNNQAEKASEKSEVLAQLHFLSLIKDLRVLIIKLADKLHNLETLQGLSPDRQKTFMKEVKKIYIPAAEILGISKLKRDLETTLFKYQFPNEYEEINRYIHTHIESGTKLVEKITKDLETVVELTSCKATVQGRLKSIPSIYAKLKKYSKEGLPDTLTNLYDIIAFRILTNTEKDCYEILSTITSVYSIKMDRIRDYIAKPKPNGYRSIHLIANEQNKYPFEIQIRTFEMHEHNEYGPSSHLAYKKQGRRYATSSTDYSWLSTINKQMQYYQRYDDKPITVELFRDVAFVLTPANDYYQLPKDATPIDLAYAVHSQLGNQCVGAKVNGKVVPLHTKLQTGDVVEILKNPSKLYPDSAWLDIVKTEEARLKIQHTLKRKTRSGSTESH